MNGKRPQNERTGQTSPKPAGRRRAALWLLAGALLVVSMVAVGCSGDQGGTTVTVTIKDLRFTPQTVTVSPGTTVRWVNNDATAHTSTSAAFNPDAKSQPSGAWDSPILNPGQSWSRRFDTPGTYHYGCSIHPYITGTVKVRAQ